MVLLSFGSTEVEKRLLFCQKRQSNRMRNSCIYLSIKDVNPHPTPLFSTCCSPSFLCVLVLLRPQRPVEICIKMLLTWEVAVHMSQNCYFNKLMKISIHLFYSVPYFQALLWPWDGHLHRCMFLWERKLWLSCRYTIGEDTDTTQNYSANTSTRFWIKNIGSAWTFVGSSAYVLIQLS